MRRAPAGWGMVARLMAAGAVVLAAGFGVGAAGTAVRSYERLAVLSEPGRAAQEPPAVPVWLPLAEQARAYGVPERVLADALVAEGLSQAGQGGDDLGTRSPRDIAVRSGRETAEVRRTLAASVQRYRADGAPAPPTPQGPRLPRLPGLGGPPAPGRAPLPPAPLPPAEPGGTVFPGWLQWPSWLGGAYDASDGGGLTGWALELLPRYGYWVLGAATLAGAVGAPIPLTPLLVSAGALTASGTLGFAGAFAATLAAAVGGDSAGYALGRRAGQGALRRVGPRIGLSAERLEGAERAFGRWGAAAVWLTRWLVTPLGPTVNVLAGANRLHFRRFLLVGAVGEAMWAGGYLGIGWLFGENWEAVLEAARGLWGMALGLAVASVLGFVGWRLRRASLTRPTTS